MNIELKATPLVGGLPQKIGGLRLSLVEHEKITAIMPARGCLSKVKTALGAWPEAGASVMSKKGELVWSALDQAFLFGSASIAAAACVDISDGWVFFELSGKAADQVMARLTPLDLRPEKVETGQVFRSMLGHLQALIIVREKGFEIGVMSSFGETAKHEIIEVIETIEALFS